MAETFFEDPTYVWITLVFAEIVLAALWYEKRTRGWALSLAAPVLLAGIVTLVAWLVVTDREQILNVSREIAAAVEDGQAERIPQHLDEDFSASILGQRIARARVVAYCNSQTRQWGIKSITFHKPNVEVTGDEATMNLTTFITYGRDGGGKTSMIWEVLWIKRSGRWRVSEVIEARQGFKL